VNNFNLGDHQNVNLDPLDDMGHYVELGPDEPNEIGDRVLWGTPKYGQGPIGPSDYVSGVKHSGIVTGVDSKGNTTAITSKAGQGNITKHDPRAYDSSFGTERHYYRMRRCPDSRYPNLNSGF
jgi:hypothetical protein